MSVPYIDKFTVYRNSDGRVMRVEGEDYEGTFKVQLPLTGFFFDYQHLGGDRTHLIVGTHRVKIVENAETLPVVQ